MYLLKHRWIYGLLVLGLIIYFLVDAVLTVSDSRLAPVPAIDEGAVKTTTYPTATVRPLKQYAIISERNLFGGRPQGQATPPIKEDELEGIPKAVNSLGLKLVGTVVATRSEESFAIIEARGKRKQEIYHEGDRVQQALIKKILRHNVVINTGKRDEVLTMRLGESSPNRSTPRRAVPARKRPTAGRGRPIRLEREEIESSMADMNQLSQQVRIRPYVEGNKPAGFLVSNIKPGSIFAKMGLRNGDVIQQIDDQTIMSPDQMIEFYEILMEGEAFALGIRRGRRKQELRYQID